MAALSGAISYLCSDPATNSPFTIAPFCTTQTSLCASRSHVTVPSRFTTSDLERVSGSFTGFVLGSAATEAAAKENKRTTAVFIIPLPVLLEHHPYEPGECSSD